MTPSSKIFQRLREQAERLLKAEVRQAPVTNAGDLLELSHELEVHQVELELQNEELKHTLAELEASRDAFWDLYNLSPVAYVTLDEKNAIEKANLAALELLDATKEVFLGIPFALFVHAEDVPIYLSFIKQIRAARNAETIELRLRGAQGPIQVHLQGSYWVEERESTGQLRLVLVDITERKKMEQRLAESEERLRIVIEGGRLGIWDRDYVADTISWNRYLYTLLDRDPDGEQITGDTFFEYIHPDDQGRVREHLEACLQEGDDFKDEFRVVREDGRTRWMDSRARLYRNAEGRPMRMAGTTSDITERKRLEIELDRDREALELRVEERTRELENRAKELARMSSQLTLTEHRERRRIAEILHDHLQQLMVAAKLGQEVLINDIEAGLKPGAERVLDLILRSIEASRALTAELSPPVLESGDLIASVKWLARWMRQTHGLEVTLRVEDGILLDWKDYAVLIFQSIRELLFNVLKHAGTKSATLRVTRQEGTIRIDVSDRGTGFDLERVLSESGDGDKFGLISIRERLRHLGGTLVLDSAPGKGSTLSLILPMDGGLAHEAPARNVAGAVLPTVDPGAPGGEGHKRCRIMLVDDHPVMREGLSRLLSFQTDMEVVAEAPDGEAAVQLARAVQPNVILMDINMPKMNGLEATRIIHDEFPHIRIIALSVFDEEDQAAAMIDAGAFAYRSKSGDTALLLATIRGDDV